jgi:hypothetical protein
MTLYDIIWQSILSFIFISYYIILMTIIWYIDCKSYDIILILSYLYHLCILSLIKKNVIYHVILWHLIFRIFRIILCHPATDPVTDWANGATPRYPRPTCDQRLAHPAPCRSVTPGAHGERCRIYQKKNGRVGESSWRTQRSISLSRYRYRYSYIIYIYSRIHTYIPYIYIYIHVCICIFYMYQNAMFSHPPITNGRISSSVV